MNGLLLNFSLRKKKETFEISLAFLCLLKYLKSVQPGVLLLKLCLKSLQEKLLANCTNMTTCLIRHVIKSHSLPLLVVVAVEVALLLALSRTIQHLSVGSMPG